MMMMLFFMSFFSLPLIFVLGVVFFFLFDFVFSSVILLSFQHAHPSHQYTAPSRLLWRIRVITFVDLGKGKEKG